MHSLWLGLSDLEVHSVYRTVEGILPAWTNWYPWQPSFEEKLKTGHTLEQSCAVRIRTDGKWDDNDCGRTERFYCETKGNSFQIKGL